MAYDSQVQTDGSYETFGGVRYFHTHNPHLSRGAGLKPLLITGVIAAIMGGYAWLSSRNEPSREQITRELGLVAQNRPASVATMDRITTLPGRFYTEKGLALRLKEIAGVRSGRIAVRKHAPTGVNPDGFYTQVWLDYGTPGRTSIDDMYAEADLTATLKSADADSNRIIPEDEVKAEEARVFARFAKPASQTSW